jgi:plasmid maintenance system killer protein
MDVQFAESSLALVETDRAAETALPVAVIRSLRHRLHVLRAARTIDTLLCWQSCRLLPDVAADGERVILINDSWRMAVRFNGTSPPICATVLRVTNTENRGAAND